MIYGLIIAAGNQTRFNDSVPKALSKVGDTTVLDINIKNMKKYCDKVFVVCSYDNEEYFKDYKTIVIDSGRGCGDAVYCALNLLEYSNNDTCFIQWGDCLHRDDIYKAVVENFDGDILVPCTWEKEPYVEVVADEDNKISIVYFSKYGEHIHEGWHDLSLFYGYAKDFYEYCEQFSDLFYSPKKDYYKSTHGIEFNFLDIFRFCHAKGKVLPMKDYKSLDFNTKEELEEVQKYYERLSSIEG